MTETTPSDGSQPDRGPRRATMKDIAAQANVHKTTVSLALRNHPSIPERTRNVIREIAQRIGYLPDPTLEAFNFHRLSNHPVRSAPSMAFLTDLPSLAAFEASPSHRELYKGARQQAGAMGYTLEPFFVGPNQLSPARLNHVLDSRNISYVILGAFTTNTAALPLNWQQLYGLKIESFHVQPRLDTITANHREAARTAVMHMRELGYRRIGLVLSRDEDLRLANLSHAGFLVEQQEGQEEPAVAFTDHIPRQQLADFLHRWILHHRLDGLIAGDSAVASLIATQTQLVPSVVGLCSLDVGAAAGRIAGIVTPGQLVGARAVELLAITMHTNRRGLPAHTSTTYVPATWQPGDSAPARRKRPAKNPGRTRKV